MSLLNMYLVPMNMDRRRKEEDGLEVIDDRYEEDEDVGEDEMNHLHNSIILLIYFWLLVLFQMSHYSV